MWGSTPVPHVNPNVVPPGHMHGEVGWLYSLPEGFTMVEDSAGNQATYYYRGMFFLTIINMPTLGDDEWNSEIIVRDFRTGKMTHIKSPAEVHVVRAPFGKVYCYKGKLLRKWPLDAIEPATQEVDVFGPQAGDIGYLQMLGSESRVKAHPELKEQTMFEDVGKRPAHPRNPQYWVGKIVETWQNIVAALGL